MLQCKFVDAWNWKKKSRKNIHSISKWDNSDWLRIANDLRSSTKPEFESVVNSCPISSCSCSHTSFQVPATAARKLNEALENDLTSLAARFAYQLARPKDFPFRHIAHVLCVFAFYGVILCCLCGPICQKHVGYRKYGPNARHSWRCRGFVCSVQLLAFIYVRG